MPKKVRRFYGQLKPSHYQLDLVPDISKMVFSGHVKIFLTKTGRPSQRMTLHQSNLTIENATIIRHDKTGDHQQIIERINRQNKFNEVRLHTAELLYAGSYEVSIDFKGKITSGMTGLYPCYFRRGDKKNVLLATQFESHHAREVFPCIDEPEAKATFQLSLTAPKDQVVLSNTPVAKKEIKSALLTKTQFELTPIMSTYLLAFVIGDLHRQTTTTKRGTEVSVWATTAQPKDSLQFGLEVAKRSIEFFENYFGVDYPLAKADHVALPDFASGAMENWGLITYRERVLLADPTSASQSTKELIATVVAHETSHQWFGNLVTMRWWDDLWLNESFANLMEYQAVDAMFPDWKIWETFAMSEGLAALRRDAITGVQAVKTSVKHPDEISTLFDGAIVYAKGGRLLYMLKKFIGEEKFRQGLKIYFKAHAYSNTSGRDLWSALTESSGQDIAAFMNPWLEQSGFPVVSVNQDKTKISISQAHFLNNGIAEDGKLWPTPLFSNNSQIPDLLKKTEINLKLAKTAETIVINQGAGGHYIVNYQQAAHRQKLIRLINNNFLGTVDRLMLLNNASMLAKAGQQKFGEVLELLDAYQHETSETVWGMISIINSEARRFAEMDDSLEADIKKSIRHLIKDQYQRLGWQEKPKESLADRKLRAIIVGLGAYAEQPAIIKESLRYFDLYKDNPNNLNSELRSIVFSVAIKRQTKNAFDFQLELYDKTNNGELKSDLTASLTATRDKAETEILLGRLKDPALIKPQDTAYWIVDLLINKYTRDAAWHWLKSNWQWIEKTYGHEKSYDDYPRYAATICNTKDWAKQYKSFFEPKRDEVTLRRNIDIGLAEIDQRLQWLQRDLASVQHFFKK